MTQSMNKSTIKDKKVMVDAIIQNFKSMPATAITFSNKKTN